MRIRLPVARLASVLLFAALCAIVAGWALQLFAPRAPIAPGGAVAQAQPPVDVRQAGQLFGGAPKPAGAVAAAPSNIQVTGVLAAGDRGVALLVIDGKPAQPFQVGEAVADGMKLVSVTGDAVGLDQRGQAVSLPAPARGSIAVLTSGPSRNTDGMQSASGAPSPVSSLPPLPPRVLPPAGAAAVPVAQALPPGTQPADAPGTPGAAQGPAPASR
jgi:general secretion pathway protein C